MEIYYNGSWEAICYDGWDVHDAYVACRQLGFSGADSITRETGMGIASSLKRVQCKGNENTLGDCVHDDWSVGNCSYGYAGVICTGMLGFISSFTLNFSNSRAFGCHAIFPMSRLAGFLCPIVGE